MFFKVLKLSEQDRPPNVPIFRCIKAVQSVQLNHNRRIQMLPTWSGSLISSIRLQEILLNCGGYVASICNPIWTRQDAFRLPSFRYGSQRYDPSHRAPHPPAPISSNPNWCQTGAKTPRPTMTQDDLSHHESSSFVDGCSC